jgi:predicted DNA-binding transcriptional regulator YafY
VDPLGLVAKGSTWYLVANTQRGLRTFRVSRIEKAKLLEQDVKRPAGFDLAVYWKSSTEQFREGWRPYEVLLRLEPRAAAWMQTWHIASAHQEGNEPNAADDWVTLRVRFDHEKEALFMALGLGSRVEVLEPVSLREQVASEIAAVLRRSRGELGQPSDPL